MKSFSVCVDSIAGVNALADLDCSPVAPGLMSLGDEAARHDNVSSASDIPSINR